MAEINVDIKLIFLIDKEYKIEFNMAHSFITNRDRLLSDIITGILPKSDT